MKLIILRKVAQIPWISQEQQIIVPYQNPSQIEPDSHEEIFIKK